MSEIRKFKHIFECAYPDLGEVVWAKHPKYNLEVSNYGELRDPETKLNVAEDYTSCQTPHLIYEAFNNVVLKRYTSLTNINLNPYDNSPQNLKIIDKRDKERIKDESDFIDNTVKEMLRREARIKNFMDPLEYFQSLGIPKRIMKRYLLQKRLETN